MKINYRTIECANRGVWLAERQSSIGASESACLLGRHPWLTEFQLWSRKIGLEPNDPPNIPMRVGLALENLVAEMYQDETDRPIEDPGDFTILALDEYPYISTTLDRWTLIDKQLCPLELKAVGTSQSSEWDDGPPEHYWCQVQHQMLVTGSTRASIAVLIGNREFRWCDVDGDAEFQAALLIACRDFWHLVETETPPEVDGRRETAEALARLYPVPTDKVVILPPEFQDVDERLVEVGIEITNLELEKRLLQNKLRAAIGDATIGELPDCRYKWAVQERKAYEVKASSSRVLRRLKKGG